MAKGKTKGKTNTAANMVVMPQEIAVNKGAAIAWAKAQGLPSFSALVIGTGSNPTNVPNPKTVAGQRKAVLANNAMVGQTVGAYYKAAKAHTGNTGSITPNNPCMAAKAGLITLLAPTKSSPLIN